MPCLTNLLGFFPKGKQPQLAKLWRKHGKNFQKKSFRYLEDRGLQLSLFFLFFSLILKYYVARVRAVCS